MPDPAKWTGKFGRTCENIRTVIANSAYFRTLTGAADADAALAFIIDHTDNEENLTTPYCVVAHEEGLRLSRISDTHNFGLWVEGSYSVRFVADYDTTNYASDPEGAMRKFRNDISGAVESDVTDSYDGVITEVIANIETGGYIAQVQAIRPGTLNWYDGDANGWTTDRFHWTWYFDLTA